MGRINQDIVEYSFSPKLSTLYNLNVLLGANSVYYTVSDAEQRILVLKSFHNDEKKNASVTALLKDVFFEDPILNAVYKSVKVGFSTPHQTLVPRKFYSETDKPLYLKNLTAEDSLNSIGADSIDALDIVNVYAAEKNLIGLIQAVFPKAKYYHNITSLLLGFDRTAKHSPTPQVFANIRDNTVQLFFFTQQKPVFANVFPFKTSQDIIYYILLVYEQFKLNPDETPLVLSGTVTQDSDIYKYIYRYIRHVNFITIPELMHLGQQFTGIPHHFYFDLFSLKDCE
jgi:hypothetical protein